MFGRQRPRGLSISLALCAFFAAVSGACSSSEPRTQVMLIIDAEEAVRARATELKVTFESRGALDHIEGNPYTETFAIAEGVTPYWPFSIAVLPRNGDTRRVYRVTATLSDAEGVSAVLRAHSGFVAQRTLELRLLFTEDCLGEKSLDCSEQESCSYGECLSAVVDAKSLPALGGDGIVSDADGGITNSSTRTGSQTGTDGGTAQAGRGPGRSGRGTAGSGGMSGPGTNGDAGPDGGTTPVTSGGNCGDGTKNEGEQCDTAIPQGMPDACPTMCPAAASCMTAQLEGSGCQARCMTYPIVIAAPDDGCCPDGVDASSDNDCGAVCGNGVIEASENCDPIADCPVEGSSCAGASACLQATIAGDAASCTAVCNMQPVAECMGGDGCCPDGCRNDNDSDCSASCNNGMVDTTAGELCEPTSTESPCPTSCDDGNPCTEDFLTGSAANCNATCTHVAITRPRNGDRCCPMGANNNNDDDCAAACGNGIRERGEFCDGPLCPTQPAQCNDLNACTTETITGTECQRHCTYTVILLPAAGDSCCPFGANANTDGDCPAICGNGAVEPGEQCDGSCPTSCPDDGDNNACTVSTVANSGCQRKCESRRLTANTGGPDGCCPAGANPSTDSDCQPPPAMCGNGTRDTGEMCDPCPTSCPPPSGCVRHELSGTGCNVRCTDVPVTGPAPGDTCCPAGENSATDSDCTNPPPPACGNDRVESGEICDGNCPTSCPPPSDCVDHRLTGTGCNVSCVDEPVANCCPAGGTWPSNPACPGCGNGRRDDGELCDGNCPESCPAPSNCERHVISGSGCSVRCTDEPITGPAPNDNCCPPGQNSATDNDCTNAPPAVCGNGRTEPGESCDGSDCPSCDDPDPCTDDIRIDIPDACHPMCRHPPIPARRSGADGCCPNGADSSTDSDCSNSPPT